jgi:hypothetical protein
MDLTVPDAIKLAISHHREGRLDEAEELYKLILQAEPDDPARRRMTAGSLH